MKVPFLDLSLQHKAIREQAASRKFEFADE